MPSPKSYFKLASGVLKKPRSKAKRALPYWKQQRKRLLEMEGKTIKGKSLKRHGDPIKVDWKPTKEAKYSADHILYQGGAKVPKTPPGYQHRSRSEKIVRSKAVYISPPSVKPKVKITKKQMQRYAARTLESREKGLRNLVSQTEPRSDELFTRLYTEKDIGGEKVRNFEEMPYGRGMSKYIMSRKGMIKDKPGGSPVNYYPDKYSQPPAKVLSPDADQPFRKRKLRSVWPEFTKRATDADAVGIEKAMSQKQSIDQARDVKTLKRRLGSAGRQLEERLPAEELLNASIVAGELWKAFGGGRSVVGRWWQRALKGSRGRTKPKTAESYFTRIMIKWLNDPEATEKVYKREINNPNFGIKVLWETFND